MSLQKLEFLIIYSIKMKPTKLSPITRYLDHIKLILRLILQFEKTIFQSMQSNTYI